MAKRLKHDLSSSGEPGLTAVPIELPATIPAVLVRGGTSKGVFFHLKDLPPFGEALDQLLLNIMGSPDPMQIDGLGGTYSSTSKVIIVAPGDRPEIDVRYWFAQIGIDEPIVDWSGNCGNLTTAVGPFAIDEGLVEAIEPNTEVRLFNENTSVTVVATVQVADGRAKETGDLVISGVPNSGAPVVTKFLNPGGAVYGKALPTGNPTDVVSTTDGDFDVSIVDVTHPYAILRGADLGLDLASADPKSLNTDAALLARVGRLQPACAALIREATGSTKVSPILPRLIFVASPGEHGSGADADLLALGVSMGAFHHAVPMTGALCLGAAARLTGTVPRKILDTTAGYRIVIGHPKGTVVVTADTFEGPGGAEVGSVGVVRTARRLMSGTVNVRQTA